MNPDYFQGKRLVDISGGLNALYICCDIVQPRIVDDVLASLLDVVPVNKKSGKIMARRFEKIHYVPVIRKTSQTFALLFETVLESVYVFRKEK